VLGREKFATMLVIATENGRKAQELMTKRGTRGGKDVAVLSGNLVTSTLTGRNGDTPGTVIFARPAAGGDGGNDSELLAEALGIGGDGGRKDARNG
jgi:hypothetical protein